MGESMRAQGILAAVALLAGTCALAGVANAEVIVVATFQGVITGGTDGIGLFGSQGTDLTGDSYTAVFRANTSTGVSDFTPPFYSFIYGGERFGVHPTVSADVTINGVTFHIGGQAYGDVTTQSLAIGDADQYSDSEDNDASVYDDISSFSHGFTPSYSYTVPYSYTRQSGDFGNGGFAADDGSLATNASLNPMFVSISSFETPEPLTLSLFGASLVGAAAAMRRRRKANKSS